MLSQRAFPFARASLVVGLVVLGISVSLPSSAKDYSDEETAALLKVLPAAKVSLADGVRQAAKGGETPTSAKFELDDSKKLSLSVYTAEKGTAVDPEHNVLKEISGSPEQATWTPESEVFKDVPHVARASEQLALTALAKSSLADFIGLAEKQNKGMVFSAIPEIQNHRPVLVLLTAEKGKVNELRYDLQTGRAVTAE